MAVSVGDRVPDVEVKTMGEQGPESIRTGDVLGKGRVVLFAVPGAFTPTEILAAWRAGAAAVKLFPASAVGPTFVREVRGPLPGIPLIPTGGVTAETAPAFIAAGAVAVGIGSWLTGSGDPAVVEERAAELVAAVASARSAKPAGPAR